MNLNNIFLSVVIPAYNEKSVIKGTLEEVAAYLSAQPFASETIVVDDGSKDTTLEIARSCSGLFGDLRILENPRNLGKGAAVRKGVFEAKGEYILFMDADNSTSIRELEKFPYRDSSVLAAGVRAGIPVTVHVCIGQDIIHEHPNFDGAATGSASYTDFLIYTQSIMNLEGGVLMNLGTAVMGPEVYLKALSMARNAAMQEGKKICHFTTAVFDLQNIGDDLDSEAPKNDPRYYFRPYKTILVRTVADGGKSYYVCGEHQRTIPELYDEIMKRIQP